VACFAKTDPVAMKVSSAHRARRRLDEYKAKKTAFSGADRAEASGCGCATSKRTATGNK
jgi:hypothetical protein